MSVSPGISLLIGLMTLMLLACAGDPDTGPRDVKWDRDICERCRMVLSDRHYSAQIRYVPVAGSRSRVAVFDDIGCAALWLKDKPWKDDPGTEIWVNDYRSGEWVDAHTASYIKDKITPMEYGLGAQPEPVEGGLNFEQAKRHIEEVEQRFSIHGVQLLERLKEQAEQREVERKGRKNHE